MTEKTQTAQDWWLGVGHLVTHGVAEGAIKVQRVHLSIADETFNVLARIPVTRPVSEPVRALHHGISRLCYGTAAQLAGAAAKVTQQALPKD
ncbi:hypothetical protein [Marinobacter zhejiangensis]|uniref:hypothetical protein n=1 Tax=Marinobacter zhejiangensis TaxID=488535 RepID=UPI000B86D4AB|nr:hypothetical protein [Marinobacter zhejiangensis]